MISREPFYNNQVDVDAYEDQLTDNLCIKIRQRGTELYTQKRGLIITVPRSYIFQLMPIVPECSQYPRGHIDYRGLLEEPADEFTMDKRLSILPCDFDGEL